MENPGPGRINLALQLSMLVIFVGLGFLFIATDTWIDRYPKPTRIYIGAILLGWGVFRGISVWMKWRKMKNDEDESGRF